MIPAIGSGSGTSVIPLGERLPAANIVATDISPQLLAILQQYLRDHATEASRFAQVGVDAMTADYRPEVGVGAAILHSIIDPARMPASCQRALKSGSWAMFFEPFEAGAENIGCPLNMSRTPLRTRAGAPLRPGAQIESSAPPQWAWSAIDDIDTGMSEELRRERAPVAAVLQRKAASPCAAAPSTRS